MKLLLVRFDWRTQNTFLLHQAMGRIAWVSDVVRVLLFKKLIMRWWHTGKILERSVISQDGPGQGFSTVGGFAHPREH